MDIIKDTVDEKSLEDLVTAKVVISPKEVAITKEAIEAAIILLKDVEDNGGHQGIAGTVGLSRNTVSKIHKAMYERISALSAVGDVEEIIEEIPVKEAK